MLSQSWGKLPCIFSISARRSLASPWTADWSSTQHVIHVVAPLFIQFSRRYCTQMAAQRPWRGVFSSFFNVFSKRLKEIYEPEMLVSVYFEFGSNIHQMMIINYKMTYQGLNKSQGSSRNYSKSSQSFMHIPKPSSGQMCDICPF